MVNTLIRRVSNFIQAFMNLYLCMKRDSATVSQDLKSAWLYLKLFE